jgi:hypothetical protein
MTAFTDREDIEDGGAAADLGLALYRKARDAGFERLADGIWDALRDQLGDFTNCEHQIDAWMYQEAGK